jgi:hypothetical protein
MRYGLAFRVAVSRLVNALLFGYSGEMLSARAYRLRNKSLFWGITMELLDSIFFWQLDHCKGCYEFELNNLDKPQEYVCSR